MLKIIKSEMYDMIKKSLKETGGQCPCVPSYLWNKDTVCMCKEFKKQKEPGQCHCGMYEKVEVEN